jgi:hypothetical protein
MGIVDFLQEWNLRKRVERAAKIYIQRNDPQGVSVMKPSPYRDRFQRKMEQIFDLDDPFGLFNERGSASVRKNYFLASADGHPIISNPSYREIPRENNSDSKEGEGTVMNALLTSAGATAAGGGGAGGGQQHHFPVTSYIPQVNSPFSSHSTSTIQHISSYEPHRLYQSHSQSHSHGQGEKGEKEEEEEGEEDEFGLKALSHEKLTTVDIDH